MSRASGSSSSAVPPSVARAAVDWWLRLYTAGPVSDAERVRWQAWLQADASHAQAWQQIEATGQRLAAVPSGVAQAALQAPARTRRRLLGLGLGVGLLGAGWWQMQSSPGLGWADHATGVGEQRHLALGEGTELWLNTDSAVDLDARLPAPTVTLRRGEILMASTGPQPWAVQTPQGRLHPQDARLQVRLDSDGTALAVHDGLVLAQPRQGVVQRVAAGERGLLTVDGFLPGAARPLADAAWAQGQLVVQGWPLAAFLAELARYRRGQIRCDPQVAQLPISGVYPLADTERILAALPQVLPVRVEYTTRYWVQVKARAPAATAV